MANTYFGVDPVNDPGRMGKIRNNWNKINNTSFGDWLNNTVVGDRGRSNPHQFYNYATGTIGGDIGGYSDTMEKDPDMFQMQAMSNAGINPLGDHGRWYTQNYGYDDMINMMSAYTDIGAEDGMGPQATANFLADHANFTRGNDSMFGADNRTTGQTLSEVLGGNDSVMSQNLMNASSQEQSEMIGNFIETSLTGTANQAYQQAVMSQYQMQMLQHRSAQANGDERNFIEFLTDENSAFLNRIWGSNSWNAMDFPDIASEGESPGGQGPSGAAKGAVNVATEAAANTATMMGGPQGAVAGLGARMGRDLANWEANNVDPENDMYRFLPHRGVTGQIGGGVGRAVWDRVNPF